MGMAFTDLLDEYLDAKKSLEAARHNRDHEDSRVPPEEDRYEAAKKALDDLVAKLIQAEASLRVRDTVQPLPAGFP